MFIKRLFPRRWATIAAWTGAALAWGSVGVAVAGQQPDQGVEESAVLPKVVPASPAKAAVPTMPANGLFIIRYTPVEAPAAQVVVNTVTRSVPSPVSTPPTVSSSGS